LDAQARQTLMDFADGDGRHFLTLLEEVFQAAFDQPFDRAGLSQFLQRRAPAYDKNKDEHYNLISALHKSVRASDPDASLYWLARMLHGGENPLFIARRLVRMASEDIGLADPTALRVTIAARDAFEFLGSPEGELAIAEAVVYLALAPKSNAAYKAYNAARAFVKSDRSREVPAHLRNAPTRLMKDLGHGQAYRYAHDEPHGYAAGQSYLPEGMAEPNWYRPTDRGLEAKIAEKMAFLRRLDQGSAPG
jgi:putative ATPase